MIVDGFYTTQFPKNGVLVKQESVKFDIPIMPVL